MKLKLHEKEQEPLRLRLRIPGALAGKLENYIAYVRENCRRDVQRSEVFTRMLAQFMDSDVSFRKWRNRCEPVANIESGNGPELGPGSGSELGQSGNGFRASVRKAR